MMRSETLTKIAESLEVERLIAEFFANGNTIKQCESTEMKKEVISRQEANNINWRNRERLAK